ncbi:MAG: coproporphyrinogen-III oxidase family protein [Spirochaetota bacterium]
MTLAEVDHPHSVALYVHVPFCRAKCDYCGFYSCPPRGETELRVTVEATIAQARRLLDETGHPEVTTLYFGGGTPSILDPSLLEHLARGVLDACGGEAAGITEWTIEANPGDLTEAWLQAVSELPITRVSGGVQSFSASVRRFLGRPSPDTGAIIAGLDAVSRAVSRRDGPTLSVDLIAADPREVLSDVRRAVETGTEHISLYTLSVEPGTPLARRVVDRHEGLPDMDETAGAVEAARDYLATEGFDRYEVSNYARPGAECRHNETYWLLDPYLGVGPGAVSTLPNGDGRALRLSMPRQPSALEGPNVEVVPRRGFLLEHFMTGLRRRNGLSLERLRRRFGITPTATIPATVARWRRAGFLELTEEAMRVTGDGMWYLDALLRDIAGELDVGEGGWYRCP